NRAKALARTAKAGRSGTDEDCEIGSVMNLVYKTTVNSVPLRKHVLDYDAEDAFVTRIPVYSGECTPAPGHTVESEAGWNNWWQANFDAQMEHNIIPAVGDALGEIRMQLRDEIKELRNQVAELKRELEQVRADSVVTLPRSAWRHNAA